MHGFVAREATLRAALPAGTALTRLRFGLVLLPASAELDRALGGEPAEPPFVEFVRLTVPLLRFAEEASARGPIAWLEAESADGAAFHSAAVWHGGRRVLGPLHAEGRGPVNRALRMLGVTRRDGEDELASSGLEK
jgi:hypothetical protein